MHGLVPEDRARPFVEGEDLPAMSHHVRSGIDPGDVAVPENEGGLTRRVGDRRREVHPIPPDDRARVREAFHRNAPEKVAFLRDAPLEGQVLSIGDTASVRTAKLGPILGFELGSENEKERGMKQRTSSPPSTKKD
jgi:hypothetical protein